MSEPQKAHSTSDKLIEDLVRRYADDPLKHRLLMRLYGHRESAMTLADLSDPLRVPHSGARKSLNGLVQDGLVEEGKKGGDVAYSLSSSPFARNLVTAVLRRAIEAQGKPGS